MRRLSRGAALERSHGRKAVVHYRTRSNDAQLGSSKFPSSPRRGGCAIKKQLRSHLSRADGVVIQFQQIVFVIDHHPVRSIKGCFAPFSLLSRPPLLGEEGKGSPGAREMLGNRPVPG